MAKLEFLLTDQIQNAIPNLDSVVKALAKGDVSGLTNTPTGSIKWQFDVNGVLSFHKQNEAGTLEQILSLNIDVTKLGGYLPSINAVVNTIPVRNSSNKIVGDLQGKADTAGTADTLSSVLPVSLGGTGTNSIPSIKTNLGIITLETAVSSLDTTVDEHASAIAENRFDIDNPVSATTTQKGVVQYATDEQLETLTPEQLESYTINARQHNAKANVDMDNLSAVGKSTVSGLGMPSTKYIALTMPTVANETVPYTAPATGYIAYSVRASSTSTAIGILNNATGVSPRVYGEDLIISACAPVQKGDNISLVFFGTLSTNTTGNYARFVYTEGSSNE